MDDVSLITKKRRRSKPLDPRTLIGLQRAIDAARKDVKKDEALIQQITSGASFTGIGKELGISRQRATVLAKRAILRRYIVEQVDAGTPLEQLATDIMRLYPRKPVDWRGD